MTIKGKKQTIEHIRKRAEAIKGFKHTDEAKAKMSLWHKGKSVFEGRKHSEESKKKMSNARIGRFTNDRIWNWKGDNVGYNALHSWINRKLGKPNTCENCKKSGLVGRQIHWANVSREYKRDLTDWKRLCKKCHEIYDHAVIL